MSKLIKGGTVVTADLTTRADVFVQHDKIVAVGADLDHAADHIIDASGCYVMPGGIDPHTHMEMPFMGTFSSDDFDTGTAAALSGGTTMIVDFCLPSPQQGLIDALQQWHQKAGKARTDYSFHMAITWWGEQVFNEMPKVVAEGINTFKHFMAYKGALMVNDDEMFASFSRCAELGALPLVHAENGDVVAFLQQKLLGEGNNGPEAHAYSRPPDVEGEAVNRAIMIADQAGVPVYIVHVSCEQAHEAIRRARQKGMRAFGEPLIQHLVLDDSEYANPDWDHAARRVMSPPFRNKLHQDSLWAGLAAGSLQVVATDHCAFTTEQKRMGLGDFTKIPNGTGGLEDRMPVLWTYGVRTGRLTMNEFVAVTSTNSAKILNMYPRKGSISVGADADIVVWDPEKRRTISKDTHHQKIDFNIFEGMEVQGINVVTLSQGKIVYKDGDVRTVKGAGRYVNRPTYAPFYGAMERVRSAREPQVVMR